MKKRKSVSEGPTWTLCAFGKVEPDKFSGGPKD
jgi:hypothetical protein